MGKLIIKNKKFKPLILSASCFFTLNLAMAETTKAIDPNSSKKENTTVSEDNSPLVSPEILEASENQQSTTTIANLLETITKQGVPEPAIRRVLETIDLYKNKTITLKEGNTFKKLKLQNFKYTVIIDFSLPSNQKRLYLINLQSGIVEKYYVAHGINTGITEALRFANKENSKMTSLGLYLTGGSYQGSHGNSLYLHGLEESNNLAFERNIVMHGAPYVSIDFLNKYNRMGRSWGCPAVSTAIIQKIIPLIKDGALLYHFHQDLMKLTQTSPTIQNMSDNQKEAPNNSDQIMPEEVNP